LPASPQPRNFFEQYVIQGLVNIDDTQTESELEDESEEEIEIKTDKTPFIGVASQSRSRSIITYYGIENHSKWIFTPLFRGVGVSSINTGGVSPFNTNSSNTNSSGTGLNTNQRRATNSNNIILQ